MSTPAPLLAARFLSIILLFLAFKLSSALPTLPNDEVEALKEIGTRLGKKDWDFSVDPCGGESGWITQNPIKGFDNNVSCDCSFSNSNLCHVVSISLGAQNLSGTIPSEMAKLPYLQTIDLTRNYLNGTIPPEWASLPLVNISLLGNRVTGSIPKQFGNISTLETLTLEHNWLSGPIPPELGNLSSIQRLFLNSNNFTGELPETLSRLTTMLEFRVSDNLLTGRIPAFIEGWTNLERLCIQGSGLEGPIPSGIALLTNLIELSISDLNGPDATIPPFQNMKKLKRLILRSCNLIGHLPGPLGTTDLKLLDLSFNKLSGPIPSSFEELKHTKKIYLTGNLLTGSVPDWMLKEGKYIDLSYNNFTFERSRELSCQPRSLNLFASFSRNISSGIVSCLTTPVCRTKMSSFHVNCGGKQYVDGKTIYEADMESAEPTKFFRSGTDWAFSNTGHFIDNGLPKDSYIYRSTSNLSMIDSNLYRDARLSPLSLTYYGFCLVNGIYTVRLHFAEIIFTDDKTYNSLGRRIFDIFIQGVLVQKDFNIVDEAGGVGKEIVKVYNVSVTSTTLDIRFYWAGKGTTSDKSVYGPLVSAISVDPNFNPPIDIGIAPKNRKGVSVGAIVGSVAGGVFVICLVLGILCWTGFQCHRKRDLKGADLDTGSFTLRQIKAATNNFDDAYIIGAGGFGSVYKGFLSDGTIVAVKQLSSKSKQGNREFVNEIGMISALQHPHLVKLHGCCTEGNQLLLVYEYLENNSLARALFGPEEYQLQLDWPTRYNICIGVARGLAYLHEESRIKVVHRDIKTSNVLLDKNLNPKISDFGLAKLDEEENTHISTRIAGTYGYMAPEYALRGYLTDKADVYSYGVVALEIVSGMANTVDRTKQNRFILLDKALELKEKGNLMKLVDPRLGLEYNEEEVMLMINVALFCTNILPEDRPMMSSVVSMLERRVSQELVLDRTLSGLSTKDMINRTQFSQVAFRSDNQDQSMSIEGPWVASRTSGVDLYPVSHNEYLEAERHSQC